MVNFVFKDKYVIFVIPMNIGYFGNLVEFIILEEIPSILGFIFSVSKLAFYKFLDYYSNYKSK